MKLISCTLLALMLGLHASAQSNPTQGLIAYYPFDFDFTEQTGLGNDGMPKNGVGFTTDRWGIANNAANFDGVDDWIEIPINPVTATASSKMSIAFMFKTASAKAQIMISKADNMASPTVLNYQYHLGFNMPNIVGSDGLYFATNHNNACHTNGLYPTDVLVTGNPVQAGNWHCMVVTFDKGLKKIYQDGVLMAQQTVTVGATPNKIDSCYQGMLRFGMWWQNDPYYFQGALDEVRIYNRVLSSDEILGYCNNTLSVVHARRAALEFEVYPVPAREHITVSCPAVPGVGGQLNLINSLGQVVLQQPMSQKQADVSLAGLPAGIYLLKLSNGDAHVVRRFIKE